MTSTLTYNQQDMVIRVPLNSQVYKEAREERDEMLKDRTTKVEIYSMNMHLLQTLAYGIYEFRSLDIDSWYLLIMQAPRTKVIFGHDIYKNPSYDDWIITTIYPGHSRITQLKIMPLTTYEGFGSPVLANKSNNNLLFLAIVLLLIYYFITSKKNI